MKRTLLVFNFLLFASLVFCQEDHVGSGRALQFDGIDDYIEMGNIYDDVALPVSITFWLYIDPSTGSQPLPILDSQNGLPAYSGFTMQVTTYPNIGITYGDGLGGNNPDFRSSKSGNVVSLTGRWVHIAGVLRKYKDMDLYFNGHNVGGSYAGNTTSPMNSNSPAETMHVGYYFGNGIKYFFQGKMDELRIWKKVLTEEEIRKDMCRTLTGNEADLIGYWNFDETSGNVVKDKSTNHFHGELKGNPQRIYSGAPIGNESVYLYPGSWSGTTLALGDLSIQNITGNPYGAHLYKVTADPSQTNGLPAATRKNPYYGVFLAEDPAGKKFDFKIGNGLCTYFTRNDNAENTWIESTNQTDITGRVEILSAQDKPDFNVDLGANVVVCDQSTATLTAQVSNNPAGKSFLWNTGQNTQSITISESGEYLVVVTEGCASNEDAVMVSFLSTPPNFSLGSDEARCAINPWYLKSNVTKDPSYEYTWQNGAHTDSLMISDFGEYWLEIKNQCGSRSASVRFSEVVIVPIPNVITPNDDRLNQYFVIDPALAGSRIRIVNRWGKKIFESPDYQNDWDASGLQAGVYFYQISSTCIGTVKGAVHVLKP
jgi:hypothetical protein